MSGDIDEADSKSVSQHFPGLQAAEASPDFPTLIQVVQQLCPQKQTVQKRASVISAGLIVHW
jgi:hypothetical protein